MRSLLTASLLIAISSAAQDNPQALWDHAMQAMIKQLDTNNDTKVDSGEWQSTLGRGFDALDQDRNGTVTTAEIQAVQKPLVQHIGELGSLAAVSIVTQLLGMTEKAPNCTRADYDRRAQALFTKLDANTNAELDPSEFSALPQAIGDLLKAKP
jgi:Ca2+-binding EF-hand superfamily protein